MPAPQFAVVLMWAALLFALWRFREPSGPHETGDLRRLWLLGGGCVALACVIVVWMAVGIGPIDDDDWYFMVIGRWASQHASSGEAWHALLFEFGSPREPTFRPLSKLWLGLMYGLFGDNWAGWHVAGVVLQVWVAVLVYHLVRALTPDRWLAFTGAVLYGLHPSHAEVLGWCSAHETFLMTGFIVLAVTLHARDKTRWAAVCALAAMLCKEQAFAVFGAIVLVDLYARKLDWRRWVAPVAALGAILVWRAVVLAEPNNQAHAEFTSQFLDVGVGEFLAGALLMAPALIAAPVVSGLWPMETVFSALAAIAGVLVIVFATRRAGRVETLRWWALAALWAWGMMLPVLSDLKVPGMPSDPNLSPDWHLRHAHTALVLPCVAFAWALSQLPARVRDHAAAAAIVAFGAGLLMNLTPYADVGARVRAATDALDGRDWPENAGVRLVQPLDAVAPMLRFRKVVTPDAASLPLLIGEPRCGCAAMPATFDTAALPTLRKVAARFQASHMGEEDIVEPGAECGCTKWREDAVWYRLKEGRLVAD